MGRLDACHALRAEAGNRTILFGPGSRKYITGHRFLPACHRGDHDRVSVRCYADATGTARPAGRVRSSVR